ncbi:MAG: flagellar hook-associated protein FlgK [Alphaproteobacteria bacterium]|nr:flagellar hook-associated protein FlgK [Alphaproteobacteria bacterium]
MSLNISLLTAITGLNVTRTAIDVATQNVANANTEGYSRKIINLESQNIVGQGAGVRISSITRQVDEFLLRDLRIQTAAFSASEVQKQFFDSMQDLFGTLDSNSSLTTQISDLASAIEALAITPEGIAQHLDVVNAAVNMAQRFNGMSDDIQKLRLEAETEIAAAVEDVNLQLASIADLNLRISKLVGSGQSSTELEDQRDLALSRLSNYLDISYYYRGNREVVVSLGAGDALVDRLELPLSFTPSSSVSAANNTFGAITLNSVDITDRIRSGRIRGLIDLRDTSLPQMQAELDTLATKLRFQLDKIHNQGVGLPPSNALTGSRMFAGTDPFSGTGIVRISVLDSNGDFVDDNAGSAAVVDLDLAGLPVPANVTDVVDAINAAFDPAVATASLNSNGQLVIRATNATYGVAIHENTSAIAVGDETAGFSHFFGLNDLFTTGANYDSYSTAQQPSSTTPLGLTGDLVFDGYDTVGAAPFTQAVAYVPGDTLESIATKINADPTLSGAGVNITARVIREGGFYRLQVTDANGDNFFLSDGGGGTLVSSLGINRDRTGESAELSVRSNIVSNPARLSRGTLSLAGAPVIGDTGVAIGDNTAAQLLANKFSEKLSFAPSGGLPSLGNTLPEYATAILSLNATKADNVAASLEYRGNLVDQLSFQATSVSGVNIDEEMARMVLIQNSYNATARMITTISEMLDLLVDMVR